MTKSHHTVNANRLEIYQELPFYATDGLPAVGFDLEWMSARFTQLLSAHDGALRVKEITDSQALRAIICIDFERILHALVEVKEYTAQEVLTDFFAEQTAMLPTAKENVAVPELYHVGFEIYEPMDMVLQGFHYWIGRLNQLLGMRVKVKDFLRFPASQAFQDRVNAYVEIMRIWVQVDGQELMLELFDIHHPLKNSLPPFNVPLYQYHVQPESLLHHGKVSAHHRQAMQHLYQNDSIWHYAVYVESRKQVLQLHETFKTLVRHSPNYRLPFADIVQNQYDGSFYTKLINAQRKLEIEFVTHQPDS